jgi:signal transduction histidine kinase
MISLITGGGIVGLRKTDIELVENLEQILSTLRHELGNSVNSLKITLDVLRENYDLFDDAKKKEYLKRGARLLARQQQLVDAMKSYSQFKVKEQKEIAFLSFWKHFLSSASSRVEGANIKLIHHREVESCLIMGDSAALNKIMASIVENAMEAVEGMDDSVIELKVSKTNSSLKIVVEDNGSGIGRNDMPRVFTPLFTTKPGKMGMGLPIARKLLLEMEGRIKIDSVFGSGTKARVWLKSVGDQEKGDTSNIISS